MAIWEQPELIKEFKEEKKKAEIALCIPHQETVSMEWAFAFRNLKLPPHLYFMNRGMPIDVAREQMVRSALKHDVDYIFFLDSDVVLPSDAVLTLKAIAEQKNLDIVSALYWARKRGEDILQPAAWKIIQREGNIVKLAPVAAEQYIDKGAILEVDCIGLGACLIRRKVFDELDRKGVKPFFEWGLGRPNLPQVSEDFNFCLKVADHLGIHPYVATSVRAHHVCTARRNKDTGQLELVEV